jgi:predicted AAA+ superfamily ATPase
MERTDVFEEWTAYAKKKALLSREVELEPIISSSASKIVAITGIRRCGKSSLLMLIVQKLEVEGKKVAYINLEDSRIKDDKEILDNILKWFGEDGFLFLDEITSAPDWEGWLARNHEFLKGKLRLVVSSSRKGLVLPSKPLRGRILPFELFPLSFKEFLSFKGVAIEKTTVGRGRLERAFQEYLKFGGFPEVVLTKEGIDKARILNSYFKDIVGLDIAEVSHEDLGIVDAFGKYVLQSPYFSASKCLNFFKTLGYKIGKEKLLQLEKFSEAGYLFFFAQIFSYSAKDRSQYPRKAYAGDTGFYYSITGRTDFGRLYEGLAFLELRRRLQGQTGIRYWKNKAGYEADLVVTAGNRASEVLQVVYDMTDEKTVKREIRGIDECAKELKAVKLTVLTRNVSEIKTVGGRKIRFITLLDWLLE